MQKSFKRLELTLFLILSFIILISLATIFGWILQIDQLIQLNPQWPPMQFNTAFCFIISALGIFFTLKRNQVLSLIFFLILFLISSITICEYLFHLNTFIDEFFIKAYTLTHTSHAGRMSLNTALSFLLISIFLGLSLLSNKKITLILKGVITAIIFAFSCSSLVGYFSKIPTTFLWGGITGMAIHTTINFILLSSILFFLNYKNSNTKNNLYWLPMSLGLSLFIITIHLKISLTYHINNTNLLPSFANLVLLYGTISSILLTSSTYFLLLNIGKMEKFKKASIDSEKKFENAVKYSGIGMALISPTGNFLSANPALSHIIGYSEEEILKLDFQTITHPDDLNKDLELVKKVLDDKLQTYTLEKRYLKKNRETVWTSLTVSLVRDEENQPMFFISQILDITESKTQRKLLEKSNQELTESNKELEQFASVASHDLKEPLRKIHSFCDLLNQSLNNLDEKEKKYFYYIMDAAKRMDSLINDLLEFSKVGQTKIEFVEISMKEILKMALDNLEVLIKEKKANLIINDLPMVYGSKVLLAQVFQNLINNALKFIPTDRIPTIEISAQKSQHQWIFSVKDNGIGIEKKYQEKIFKLFQRLHHKSEYPGTGLGLSICQRIIEKHHGNIWIESNSQDGSTFFFSLPINYFH